MVEFLKFSESQIEDKIWKLEVYTPISIRLVYALVGLGFYFIFKWLLSLHSSFLVQISLISLLICAIMIYSAIFAYKEHMIIDLEKNVIQNSKNHSLPITGNLLMIREYGTPPWYNRISNNQIGKIREIRIISNGEDEIEILPRHVHRENIHSYCELFIEVQRWMEDLIGQKIDFTGEEVTECPECGRQFQLGYFHMSVAVKKKCPGCKIGLGMDGSGYYRVR